jgi:hypothetical protein
MFVQKHTRMLHPFTSTSTTFCGQGLGGHSAQLYDLVFIVITTAQSTDLRGI